MLNFVQNGTVIFRYYGSPIMSTKLTKSIPPIFQNIFQEKTDYF